MGQTKIEWAEKSWNPVTGCSPVSEGCLNCYAARFAKRLAGRYGYPKDDPFQVTVHHERFEEPLHWKKPSRIFVCSMGDLFHNEVPSQFVEDTFEVMSQCSQHTFVVLTKRPQNIQAKLYEQIGTSARLLGGGDFLPNVWFGVTAENEARADERIPLLLRIPAVVRFVSLEPMLGPVTFRWAQWCAVRDHNHLDGLRMLDWVICGGETGPDVRWMDLEWARRIRDECREVGVPFFFKKAGGGRPTPEDLCIRQSPTGVAR